MVPDDVPNARFAWHMFGATAREMRRQIDEHRAEDHGLPPRRSAAERVTAVPFPDWRLSDEQIARAHELEQEGWTLEDVALAIGCPPLVLEREMARYQPPYRAWVRDLGRE